MNNILKRCSIGLIVAYIITVVVFCTFSIVYSLTNLKDDFLCMIVRITVIMSIAIGALVSCKNVNSKGFINGAFVATLYTATTFVLGIFLEEATCAKLEIIVVNIIVGMLFGIVGVNRKRKRNNFIPCSFRY